MKNNDISLQCVLKFRVSMVAVSRDQIHIYRSSIGIIRHYTRLYNILNTVATDLVVYFGIVA